MSQLNGKTQRLWYNGVRWESYIRILSVLTTKWNSLWFGSSGFGRAVEGELEELLNLAALAVLVASFCPPSFWLSSLQGLIVDWVYSCSWLQECSQGWHIWESCLCLYVCCCGTRVPGVPVRHRALKSSRTRFLTNQDEAMEMRR